MRAALILMLLSLPMTTTADDHGVPSHAGRVQNFDADRSAKDRAAATAEALSELLSSDGVAYDQALRKLFGRHYGETTIYDDPQLDGMSREALVGKIESLDLTPRQKLALRFFFAGDALGEGQLEILFGRNGSLPDRLKAEKLAVEKDGKLRLNDLTVSSYMLAPVRQPMYLFSDLPKKLSASGADPESQLAITSYSLLKALEKRRKDGPALEGAAADLGSGNGIQGIALLMMNPKLKKVVGLDVDDHALNLSSFNAMLNGVGERFQPVDNKPYKAGRNNPLARALGEDEKLSLVVSNPPFNLVPSSLGEKFTRFGYGGPDGLAITKQLLQQAMPLAAPGAEMIVYSQFAIDDKGRPLFEKMLQNDVALPRGNGAAITYETDPLRHLGYGIHQSDPAVYAKGLRSYLAEHLPEKEVPSVREIEDALKKAHVARLQAAVAHLKLEPGRSGYSVESIMPHTFVPSVSPTNISGGVYDTLQRGGMYTSKHARGGAYLSETKGRRQMFFEADPRELAKMGPEVIDLLLKSEIEAAGWKLKDFLDQYKKADDSGRAALLKRVQDALKAKEK